jgi:glucose/mannose-6-phosphate isomerase
MNDLDNPAVFRERDPQDMRSQLRGLPKQCLDAWHSALSLKLPSDYRTANKVVILGMGGSAIGADLLKGLAAGQSRPLIFVNRDYTLPPYVDESTLVVASSYSGNTEEVLSAFSQALKSKCKKLILTTGGELKALADKAGIPVYTINHVSSPRAALGYSLMPLMAVLRNLELFESTQVNIESLKRHLFLLLDQINDEVPSASNPAKKLALDMQGKIAVIYGAGMLSDVARRWKTQINENSKAWAFYETFPELNHNAVVGYRYPDGMADSLFVVMLRSPRLHPRVLLRYDITADLLAQHRVSHTIVDGKGIDDLSQVMTQVFYGDWVSYYLALLNDADPTPVETIDYLKKRLSESR